MRVAHITATFPPYAGGTGGVAFNNAVQLARRGCDTHVFTALRQGAAAEEQVQDVQVHRLRPRLSYGNAHFLPQLYGRLAGFDLLHLHMPFYGGAEAVALLRRLRRTPLVITYHHDVYLGGAAGQIGRFHDRFLGDRLLQAADRVCFTSLDYGRSSRAATLIAAGRIQARELPNGVDVACFTPGPRPGYLQERYDLAGRRVLLFVGALDRAHHFKGIGVLLRALASLPCDGCRLLIAGKGDLLPAYQDLARQLGVAGRVTFCGFVPDDELRDHYRLADVTILPSTESAEAFGLVLLESLACETPVIATDLPGVRTVVENGRDGLLVAPGDAAALAAAISEILDLPQQTRREMGRAGRRRVAAAYDWPLIGGRLHALYTEVLGAANGSPNPAPAVEERTAV